MTSLNLLYVDDDDDIRTIVEMALGLDPQMTVRTAASGADALALMNAPDWRPDVMVLDVMMPGMNGIETLRALREVPGLATVPALFMTAKGREADIATYRAEGAAGVILKPFDPLQLATEIRTLTARA
jgi:two-component system, OmpR family, response regulator